jgi:hypothetical protein
MSRKKTFISKVRKEKPLSREEISAFEESEDKRLREVGIDPDGDPIMIMMEVMARYEALDPPEEIEPEA